MTARRLIATALAAALCLTLTACTSKGDPVSTPSNTSTDRPTVEEAVPGYNAMLGELRDVVTAAYPDATWTKDASGGKKVGGAADDTWIVYSPQWVVDAVISRDAATRDAIVADMNPILRDHGFIDFAVVQAKPGSFDYVADDKWGTELRFGGGSAASGLDYWTGELPSDDPTPQVPLDASLGG